jgi:predicted MFS family arabinose efflux permease
MLQALATRYRAAYAGLPREIWLLSLALFVNRAGSMVIPFLTLYLTSQRGMTEAAAGRMISVYGVGAICGAYLGGRWCSRIGELRLQTICLFAAGPLYMLVGVWRDWRAIAASLFVLSLVNEMVRPANSTAITKLSTAATRTKAFSLQRLAANLGFSFGPAIGGLLSKFSYMLLFVVDGLSTLLAGALVFHFFRLRRLAPTAEAEPAGAATIARSPLRDGAFTAFLGLSLLFMMVFMQFSSTYPLYLRDHFGLDEPGIGLMYAVNTSIIVACEMLLIDAVKHWRLMPTIACGAGLACVGFGMLPLGNAWPFAALAMTVVTIGEMLSFPLSSSFVANRSGPGREGPYLGWYMVTHALAWVLGPGLGAALYQRDRDAVWWAALGIAALVFVGFQLLARRTGPQSCGAVEAPSAPLPPPAELPLDQLPQHAS